MEKWYVKLPVNLYLNLNYFEKLKKTLFNGVLFIDDLIDSLTKVVDLIKINDLSCERLWIERSMELSTWPKLSFTYVKISYFDHLLHLTLLHLLQ